MKSAKFFSDHRRLNRFTDFAFNVGSNEFPVHKIFLAPQSSALAKIFELKTNGRCISKLETVGLSAEAVGAFLDYLYERKRPAKTDAFELFKLAVKYEIASLKVICEEIIQANLNESNAFLIFELAGDNSEVLKVAAFGKLNESLGGGLKDCLINNLERLQKIVAAKNTLIDLMTT